MSERAEGLAAPMRDEFEGGRRRLVTETWITLAVQKDQTGDLRSHDEGVIRLTMLEAGDANGGTVRQEAHGVIRVDFEP
jgi:hypothetical protein